MIEHPPDTNTMLRRRRRKLLSSLAPIRFPLAFVSGWLFTYLVGGQIGIIFYLLVASSLFLGIAAAWAISTKNKHLIPLVLGTGLLAVAGIYVHASRLPFMMMPCQTPIVLNTIAM